MARRPSPGSTMSATPWSQPSAPPGHRPRPSRPAVLAVSHPDGERIHANGNAPRRAPLDEHPVHPGVLVLVLDLVPPFFLALVHPLDVQVPRHLPLGSSPPDGQVPRGSGAGVEVLVPPHPRG